MENNILEVKNVYKSFRIPTQNSLRAYFFNVNKIKYKKFKALENISFDLKRGDWLGLIGKNGSGKSTLLKIIAGIYEQDKGEIIKNGTLVPFLELGVGFNQNLSARDNIFLNGTILNITKKELNNRFNEIVDFAEIREFLDVPLKNFSSGMKVRLAFSIAIHAEADIYLLDEVLAVGDFVFKKKCEKVFNNMKKERKTIIFVSHSSEQVKKYCNKVIWLEKGVIKDFGDNNSEIIKEYLNNNNAK